MKALGQLPGWWLVIVLILLFAMSAVGQDADKKTPPAAPSEEEASQALQKATQNPVANLITVPLQNNTNFDIGPFDRTQNVLDIEPVIPVRLSEKWNLLIRWLTPMISQPASAEDQSPSTAQQKLAPSSQTPATDAAQAQLEKAVQNPVASLISVPFQNNANFNYGPYNRTQDVLNIQPVIPANISKNWMVITRIIQPLVWQPYPNLNTGGEYGFGDMVPTFFLSPRNPSKLIWGVGPAFTIPTATSTVLGQGKFDVGPSVVVLAQPGHWTLGDLVNNQWSVAGSEHRPPVNQMLNQYFIVYQIKKGWFVTSSPIITANWRASSGNVWTVPFGGGVGRTWKLGSQPVSFQTQFFGNAAYPTGTSPWTWRFDFILLFPKLTPAEKKLIMEEQLKKLEQEQQQNPEKK